MEAWTGHPTAWTSGVSVKKDSGGTWLVPLVEHAILGLRICRFKPHTGHRAYFFFQILFIYLTGRERECEREHKQGE